MKKLLAILTTVTLLLSIALPLSVSAITTVEKTHTAGEKTTISVTNLFSRWLTNSCGMDSNVKRNGKEYVAYLGTQSNNINDSVEENYATVTFPEDGLYTFTFVANKKSGTCATVDLLLDGNVIGTVGKDGEEGAGVNIADQFSLNTSNPTWFGTTGYASPREYTVTKEVKAGAHTVGYGVTPPSDGRLILFMGNIDIEGPFKPDYPDISLTEETRIEAESMLDTKIGTGESAWANTTLRNSVMFWTSEASRSFYIGSNGEGTYLYGEPDETHYKVRTTREFLQDGWYDFEYVISGEKTNNVSKVSIALKPLDGGETIIAGTNPHPNHGLPETIDANEIKFTDTSANFMNTYMGTFKYKTSVYVPAGDYVIEVVPDLSVDNKYKFYADYIAIKVGTEPFLSGLTVEGNTYTAKVKTATNVSGKVIIAAYNGKELVAHNTLDLTEATNKIIATLTTDQTVTSVKVFVWDNTTNCTPQTVSKEFSNQ